jgi:cell division protein FtsW
MASRKRASAPPKSALHGAGGTARPPAAAPPKSALHGAGGTARPPAAARSRGGEALEGVIGRLPPDPTLATVTVLLMAIGLIAVYSAGAARGAQQFDSSAHFLSRQAIAGVIAIGAMLWFSRMSLASLQRWTMIIGLATFAVLIMVLIPGIGTKIGGARRWINFGFGLNFQPSEFARLSTVLLVAKYAANRPDEVRTIKGLFKSLLVPILYTGLILLQPDLDTGLTVLMIGGIILFIAGLPWIYVVGALAVGALGTGILIVAEPYRIERVLGFLDPWADMRGKGYQIIQCWIAMGSGGLIGKGLGQSVQKLGFLPEAHTDFIFAVIGEEGGFLVTASIIILFGLMAWRGYRIAASQTIPYARYLAAGITAMVTLQALLNLMVVTGLAPTTGVPLPFLSYGGTSLIFMTASLGILWGLSRLSSDQALSR